jgi:hypothetical protein
MNCFFFDELIAYSPHFGLYLRLPTSALVRMCWRLGAIRQNRKSLIKKYNYRIFFIKNIKMS